ncbi:MAG: PD40 domain-containing protein [Deltaproteobacteria bacterium]|nr:PD40 domain-containing protein [Deltaproteobacteria bacterium]
MKRIDFSETGICDINWSPDGEWLTYVRVEKKDNTEISKIFKAKADGASPVEMAEGTSPSFNSDNDIIYENGDEIYLNNQGNSTLLISKSDIIGGTPKRKPKCSGDGKKLIFVIDNVFHKESEARNAYPYRSFLGVADAGKRPHSQILANQQWYGGTVTWFPDHETFLHYEFDSTGGARIHMSNLKGDKLGTIFGLLPSISPDQKRLACKPKGGQSVVVYVSKAEQWDADDVETMVTKLPEGGRLSGSPPIWLDNRFVLIDEAGKLFRVDTRKQEAEEYKKIPAPVLRGTYTMVSSPARDRLAAEIETDGGFELHVFSL